MRTALIAIVILTSIIQLRTILAGPDADSYYSIAKSLAFDRNLMFDNEFKEIDYPITVSSTYHIIEHRQIGTSLIWMLIFKALKTVGLANERILKIVVNLSEYILGVLALIFIFKIATKFFDRRTSLVSVLAVTFGTNLFAYITLLSASSHISAIFFISSFLLFYFNSGQERTYLDWLILGGLGGFMLMARGDTFLYLIFPLIDLSRSFYRAIRNSGKKGRDLFVYIKDKELKKTALSSAIFILALLFTFSPQLLFWKIVLGKVFRHYAEPGFFKGSKFIEVLFSCSRGFFFFSPLLVLCYFIGLPHLYKKDKTIALSSILVFLGLIYGVGRAKFGWWGGCSFGGRYFLIFMPLFILPIAACFRRLSLRNQIIITVISVLWSLFLLMLHILGRELESYKSIIYLLNFEFFYEILQAIRGFLKEIILRFIFLKVIFLAALFLVARLFLNLVRRIKFSQSLLKKISIYSTIAIVACIHIIFIDCYSNDKKVIARLKEDGFYRDAVFGDFDKGDVSTAYLEYTIEARRDHLVDSAIDAAKKAKRLYPPRQDECFDAFYDIYTDFPNEFKVKFLKVSDAFDRLGLALKFYEREDIDNARYYFKAALSAKPDIIKTIKESKDQYFYPRLQKASDFFNKVDYEERIDN